MVKQVPCVFARWFKHRGFMGCKRKLTASGLYSLKGPGDTGEFMKAFKAV